MKRLLKENITSWVLIVINALTGILNISVENYIVTSFNALAIVFLIYTIRIKYKR